MNYLLHGFITRWSWLSDMSTNFGQSILSQQNKYLLHLPAKYQRHCLCSRARSAQMASMHHHSMQNDGFPVWLQNMCKLMWISWSWLSQLTHSRKCGSRKQASKITTTIIQLVWAVGGHVARWQFELPFPCIQCGWHAQTTKRAYLLWQLEIVGNAHFIIIIIIMTSDGWGVCNGKGEGLKFIKLWTLNSKDVKRWFHIAALKSTVWKLCRVMVRSQCRPWGPHLI